MLDRATRKVARHALDDESYGRVHVGTVRNAYERSIILLAFNCIKMLMKYIFWVRCEDAYEMSDDDDEVQKINGANPSSTFGAPNDVDATMLDYDAIMCASGVGGEDEDDDEDDEDEDDDTMEKSTTISTNDLCDGVVATTLMILALWHRNLES